ncbi:MAG: phosphorylase family protein [Acidobacteriaceae bacterium]
MRIAIIAALPGELKPLVKEWRRLPSLGRHILMWTRTDGNGDVVIAVCAGMGAEAARRAFAAAEAHGPLDVVLSVGVAGALAPKGHPGASRVGDCRVLTQVIDAQTGERFSLMESETVVSIATTARVADAAEKRRLFETYGAVMVDMEAAAVARLAAMRAIPMCCVKAVSDEAEARLPDLNRFIDATGQLRFPSFLLHVALRPQSWGPLMALGSGSARASKELAAVVEQFLREKNWNCASRMRGV